MQRGASIGLTHLTYRLPGPPRSLDELARAGRLASDPGLLREVGFAHAHLHDDGTPFEDLVIGCGEALLAEAPVPRDEIPWLFWYTGLDATDAAGASATTNGLLSRFRYPVARAQHDLALPRANSLALSQQGCSGLLASVHLAGQMLQASDGRAVLCLAGDRLPCGSKREVVYNLMSDAAGAVLVERAPARNRLLHFYQHTQPYYWDTPRLSNEILAAYFPLAQRTIQRALAGAGLDAADVAWFVPHNVSYRSWQILAGLLGVPEGRIWSRNIARVGHTVSCDHLINLCDMEARGVLRPGDILVLFTFGFGASWSCLILEH
jgi:3-oxoacyl-[acyl-carrier-protein] synthase-3